MITINGKKMGKSYNNVIRLTDMFSGNSPLLAQAYHPMTIRFFILQTQYRSTLDFGNEALQAAEKGLKRLWDAYQELLKMKTDPSKKTDESVEKQFNALCHEMDDFMNDDFNTAKVLANMFQLVNHINSFRSGDLEKATLSAETLSYVQAQFKTFLEDVLGLRDESQNGSDKLDGIMKLLIDIRQEAKVKKDYQTSDRIRKQLMEIGISLKDEKDGRVSFNME
jgi:cysteinyl-tRNA synthetase